MESAVQDRAYLPDPYDVHQENMQRLKVISMMNVSSRSAPNSPMIKRGLPDANETKKNLLSPLPARRRLDMNRGPTSKSCEDLLKSGSRSSSPSPSHSLSSSPREPGSVSSRIIQAHYLYNTSEKPGSFMLRKSDEILKQKDSPQGSLLTLSPNPSSASSSPYIQRKANSVRCKDPTLHSPSTSIVISPAQEESVVGFNVATPVKAAKNELTKVSEVTQAPVKRKNVKETLEDEISMISPRLDQTAAQLDTEKEITEKHRLRMDIGMALARGLEAQAVSTAQTQITHQDKKGANSSRGQKKTGDERRAGESQKSPAVLIKKHHYIKYGNLERDPGLLTPPKESRGSIDLAAEMSRILGGKKERRVFNELDHVEEMSSIYGSEESNEGQSVDEEENIVDAKKPSSLVFTMPPVFESKPTELKHRDYEEPLDPKLLEFSEEDYEKLKRCKYLRHGHEVDDDVEEDMGDLSNESSDSDSEPQE